MKKRLGSGFLILIFFLAILPYGVNAQKATADKVIRVAYYESESFSEGASAEGHKNGYAYEYLQKISANTGWKYEYVYGEWAELLDMLENGQVDLMLGVSYTDERSKHMSFPKSAMGYENYYIYAKEDKDFVTGDINMIRGSKIGCNANSMMEYSLEEWNEVEDMNCEVVTFSGTTELYQALEAGSIDAIVVTDNSVPSDIGLVPLIKVGQSEYYVAVNKDKPDLLDELNECLEMMNTSEPYINEILHNKYFSRAAIRIAFSDEEKQWLSEHKTIRIGYEKNFLAYCGEDKKTGEMVGALKTIISEMKKNLDQIDYEIEVVGYDTVLQSLEALDSGEVDAVFPIYKSMSEAEKRDLILTNDIAGTSMIAIVADTNFDESAENTVAITMGFTDIEWYLKEAYPNWKIKEYYEFDDCIEALENNVVDCVVESTYVYKTLFDYQDYSTVSLSKGADISFAVKRDNSELLSILNRAIAAENDSVVVAALAQYSNVSKPTTFADFAKDNILSIGITVLVILAMLTYLLANAISERRKAILAEAETAKRMGVIQSMSKVYFSSFVIDMATLTYEELTTIDVVRKTIGKIPDAQEALNQICEVTVEPDTAENLRKFVDLSNINERLAEKEFITCDYKGKVSGWSQLYFIVGERNEDRSIKTLFVTTRMIHEEKSREEAQNKNLADALEAAQYANNAKTVFLNNMSHDIRTPMNAIIGFTELAKSHINDKAAVEDYLKKINISSQHLLSLINDVLDMSRIESGKVRFEEDEVSLPKVIDDLRTIIMPSVVAKKLEITWDICDIKHEEIVADKLRVNQVLLNILSNAIKFTPQGGCISVCVSEKESSKEDFCSYEFSVRDTGIGMSEEYRAHIFEPFTRETTSTVSGIQGTGLGMAITKNIVDMMNGTIAVESEPGKGTEVIVCLDFRYGKIRDKEEFDQESISFEGKRILLVEDNILNQEIAIDILSEAGIIVEVAGDGKEAVDIVNDADSDWFDAILMDIQMPIMDGYEATMHIRALPDMKKASIPIIALTANAFEEDKKAALNAGMSGHISKPISINLLLKTLQEII